MSNVFRRVDIGTAAPTGAATLREGSSARWKIYDSGQLILELLLECSHSRSGSSRLKSVIATHALVSLVNDQVAQVGRSLLPMQ